jgi:hypothetical protein
MNHFETATATEQQKGIAQKRNPPAHPEGDRDRAHRMLRMGGGAAIPKQATATRRTSLEQDPADYPGIKVFISNLIIGLGLGIILFLLRY